MLEIILKVTYCCCCLQLLVYVPCDSRTMPFRCCVPRCKGNYPSGPKVHVSAFDEKTGQHLSFRLKVCWCLRWKKFNDWPEFNAHLLCAVRQTFIVEEFTVPFESEQPAHNRSCARPFSKHANVTLHDLLWQSVHFNFAIVSVNAYSLTIGKF